MKVLSADAANVLLSSTVDRSIEQFPWTYIYISRALRLKSYLYNMRSKHAYFVFFLFGSERRLIFNYVDRTFEEYI